MSSEISTMSQRDELRGRLLELLRETRDPYWDVLIEHGTESDGPTIDVCERPARRLAHLR